jgi:lipopolysaccharide transport system ATP-binding protein
VKDIILKAENISKQYRLGQVGTGTLSHDLNRWWHQVRGKENPYLKIGDTNDRATKGESDYVWALQDINFEVERGEVLGIIGKNGAGKSTLLKILSKVTAPTTGSIKSRGRIASLLEVGTGFNPELTGLENIYLNGAILGMTKKEITSKIDDIIDFSGCERYIDTPVKRYSSGMTVRLAFAVAAFLEPDILIIDEVLAVGDAEFQKKAIGKMQDISREGGRTVLFVSHNMSTIQTLCNTCLLMKTGKLSAHGKTNDIINIYLKESSPFGEFKRTVQTNGNPTIISGKVTESISEVMIELAIESSIEIFSSLDIRLSDNNGIPVGYNSFGSMNETQLLSIKKGITSIIFLIDTSNLAIGQYLLSFDLTIPDKLFFDRVASCLIFEVIRKPIDTDRRVLLQKWGYGSVELNIKKIQL